MVRRAACAGVVALAVALGACGEDEGSGELVWSGEPVRLTPSRLPGDRIVGGLVRNETLRTVKVRSSQVELVDADGQKVPANPTFAAAYAHRLVPPTRQVGRLSDGEARRLGAEVVLEPGREAQLTVAWRVRDGDPVAIRLPGATLRIPRTNTKGSPRIPVPKDAPGGNRPAPKPD